MANVKVNTISKVSGNNVAIDLFFKFKILYNNHRVVANTAGDIHLQF